MKTLNLRISDYTCKSKSTYKILNICIRGREELTSNDKGKIMMRKKTDSFEKLQHNDTEIKLKRSYDRSYCGQKCG